MTRMTLTAALILGMAAVSLGQFPQQILRMDEETSSEDTLYFMLQFSLPVTGIEASDFIVTPNVSGPLPVGAGSRSADLSSGVARLICPSVTGFPTTALTVELWVKTFDNSGTLVSFAESGGAADAIRLSNPDALNFFVDGVQVLNSTADVSDGVWHHVAVTWRSATGEANLYVDGSLHTTDTGAIGATLADTGSFCVYQNQSGVASGFSGEIDGEVDEVRVWNVARVAAAIADGIDQPVIAPLTPPLVLYWPIEDHEPLGVGSTGTGNFRDLTANRNHASSEPGAGSLPDSPVLSGRYHIVRVTTVGENCNGAIGLDFSGGFFGSSGGEIFTALEGPEYFFEAPNPTFGGVIANAVMPSTGSCLGGDTITIQGSGFMTGAVDTVTFGGIPGSNVTVLDDMTLTVQAPPPAGPGLVDIRLYGPCSNLVDLPDAYMSAGSTPTITSVVPSTVTCEAGQPVTIFGTGFMVNDVEMITNVKFLLSDAQSFQIVSDTEITAMTPAFAGIGSGSVFVNGPCGPVASISGFSTAASPVMLNAVSPSSGACGGGVPVVVTGSGFLAAGVPRVDWVRFDGVDATGVNVLSDTMLEAVTPPLMSAGVPVMITAGGVCTPATGLANAFTPEMLVTVPGDYPTIAAAVAAACDGTVIEIQPGVYFESGIDLGNFDIVLRGAGRDLTVVDAQGSGRVFSVSGPALIEDMTIRGGNVTGTGFGAGVRAEIPLGDLFILRNCIIESNHADATGGGVRVRGDGTSRIVGCIFRDNTSDGCGAAAAVREDSASPTALFINCRFFDNHADEMGGALFVGPSATADVIHCTVIGNTASQGAGAVTADGTCNIISSVVWENSFTTPTPSGQIDGSGLFDVRFSVVEGGAAGTSVISSDPQFRDLDGRLSGLSPCIDAADPAPGTFIQTIDIDGCPRVVGAERDIGAFERQPVTHPGTGEDVALDVLVNGVGTALCDEGQPVTVSPNDVLILSMSSPLGDFVGAVPLFVGQLFSTGTPPNDAFPGVQISLSDVPAPFIIFDGNVVGGPFGPTVFTPQPLEFLVVIPPVPGGLSVMLQVLALSPNSLNAIFATSDGLELQII